MPTATSYTLQGFSSTGASVGANDIVMQFWADYWWLFGGAGCALTWLFVRLQQRATSREAGTVQPQSFAAIRAFVPRELSPYFGVYRAGWREWLSYGYLVLWFTAMGYVVTAFMADHAFLPFVAATLCFAVAAGAAWIESLSLRIVGPQTIEFASPLGWLSWSVPLTEVRQCDLVPGQSPKLRIISRDGARSLSLTREMWTLLRDAPGAGPVDRS